MFKGKKNKRTVFILVLLIFITIISAFAITNTIKANKAIANSNISPYKYSLVVAKYGYWKTENSYFADVDGKRKDIGPVPSEHVEFDLTFPTTLIEGNYEIDSIIDFDDYNGSWSDLNYFNMEENKFKNHLMTNASIWNPQAYKGEKNTEVTFTASFKLLNPYGQGLPGSRFAFNLYGEVYECYLGVVVKYVDSDFVKDPDKWWRDHGGNPDEPGTGNVTVYVKYVDKATGKELAPMRTFKTNLGERFVTSGIGIDGYKSSEHSINDGQITDGGYIDILITPSMILHELMKGWNK